MTIRQAMGHAVKRVRQAKVRILHGSIPAVMPEGHVLGRGGASDG